MNLRRLLAAHVCGCMVRWAQGGFIRRGLPPSEDYRTSLRLRLYDTRRAGATEGGDAIMQDDSLSEAMGEGPGGAEEMVEYEQQRLDRIQRCVRSG
jgi:hypothetical protein